MTEESRTNDAIDDILAAQRSSSPMSRDDFNSIPDTMTASYSEISFHGGGGGGGGASRADVPVVLTQQQQQSPRQRPVSLEYDRSVTGSMMHGTTASATFPYSLADGGGTVHHDGTMTHFVADHLEYRIKLASPVTKKDVGDDDDTSTPSMAPPPSPPSPPPPPPPPPPQPVGRNFLQQSAQMAHHQIDVNVLSDIEIEAQYLAASVDMLTENLCNLLHSISSLTADNVETYKNAVHKLTDCMDSNIKSMYTIMAKTEEISNAMRPTEQLSVRIREIKRLVDMMDGNM